MPEELHMNALALKFAARNRSIRHLVVLGMLLAGSAFYALAQTATIVGTVTDPSGAVVPNVAVTATNLDTNLVSNTTSNDDGQYILADVIIGHYSLRAEAKGFKGTEKTGVVLHNGDRFRVDFALAVGAITDTVTVEANA